jgi:hypothetical protein
MLSGIMLSGIMLSGIMLNAMTAENTFFEPAIPSTTFCRL